MRLEELHAGNFAAWCQMRQHLWGESTEEIRASHGRYRWKRRAGTAYNLLARSDEGTYLGFVWAQLRADHVPGAEAPVWYIEGIYVEPDARQQGVGRFLISAVEQHARAQGHLGIGSDCEVEDSQSADFHRAVGFTEELRSINLFKKIDCEPALLSSRLSNQDAADDLLIREATQEDSDALEGLFLAYWFGSSIATQGRLIDLFSVDAAVATYDGGLVGAVNYTLCRENCAIVSLISDLPGRGIGSMLLRHLEAKARSNGCPLMTVVVTNDNLSALGFWQRRGYELVGIDRGSMEKARQLKPTIPRTGQAGIPITDEIIMTKVLS